MGTGFTSLSVDQREILPFPSLGDENLLWKSGEMPLHHSRACCSLLSPILLSRVIRFPPIPGKGSLSLVPVSFIPFYPCPQLPSGCGGGGNSRSPRSHKGKVNVYPVLWDGDHSPAHQKRLGMPNSKGGAGQGAVWWLGAESGLCPHLWHDSGESSPPAHRSLSVPALPLPRAANSP